MKSTRSNMMVLDEPIYKDEGLRYQINNCRITEDFLGNLLSSRFAVIAASGGSVLNYNTFLSSLPAPNRFTKTMVNFVNAAAAASNSGIVLGGNSANSVKYTVGAGSVVLEYHTILRNNSTGVLGVDFEAIIGIVNNLTVSSPTDGVYFYANRAISNNWICRTVRGGVTTTSISAVPLVDSQEYILRCEINSDATQVRYYIDNVLAATISTNIPLATTALTIGSTLRNLINGTASARQMFHDFFNLKIDYSSSKL